MTAPQSIARTASINRPPSPVPTLRSILADLCSAAARIDPHAEDAPR